MMRVWNLLGFAVKELKLTIVGIYGRKECSPSVVTQINCKFP